MGMRVCRPERLLLSLTNEVRPSALNLTCVAARGSEERTAASTTMSPQLQLDAPECEAKLLSDLKLNPLRYSTVDFLSEMLALTKSSTEGSAESGGAQRASASPSR